MNPTETDRNAANGPEAMTDHAAALRLKVTVQALREKCRTKQWPHHRIGRFYRFTEDDITAILQLTRVEPARQAKAAQSWGRQKRGA